MTKVAPPAIATCPNCGKEFFKRNGNQKYCKKECEAICRRKREREKKRVKYLICLRCGEVFEVGHQSNRTICDKCRAIIKTEDELERRLMHGQKKQKAEQPTAKETVTIETAETPVEKAAEQAGAHEVPIGADSASLPRVYARLKVNPADLVKPPFEPTVCYRDNPKPERRYEDMSAPFRKSTKGKRGKEYEGWEDDVIRVMIADGATYTAIGKKLGRTPTSVMHRANKLVVEDAWEGEKIP